MNDVSTLHGARDLLNTSGISKIDYLICNAGIANFDVRDAATETTEEAMMDIFRTNTVGVMHTIQTFLDHLKNSEMKTCCALSSRMGSIADSSDPIAMSYRVSKAGLNMLLKMFSVDPSCGLKPYVSFSICVLIYKSLFLFLLLCVCVCVCVCGDQWRLA